MSTHQEHFGRKFYQCKKSGYWMSTTKPRIRAHQWVWLNYHGKQPPGYHIHHRNDDKSDNSIGNLELIEKSRHLRHHLSTPERRKSSAIICEKIRPLTKEWHASEEGHSWHKFHAIKCRFGKWEALDYTCEMCFILYKSTKRSKTRFCSNTCKSKWRRKNKLDNIQKTCPICNDQFSVNKYSKTLTCSHKCGVVHRKYST